MVLVFGRVILVSGLDTPYVLLLILFNVPGEGRGGGYEAFDGLHARRLICRDGSGGIWWTSCSIQYIINLFTINVTSVCIQEALRNRLIDRSCANETPRPKQCSASTTASRVSQAAIF